MRGDGGGGVEEADRFERVHQVCEAGVAQRATEYCADVLEGLEAVHTRIGEAVAVRETFKLEDV